MSHDVAERAVAGRDASVLLVFSCIARLDILQDRGAEEAARLQAAAGRRADLRRLHVRRVRADDERGRLPQLDRRRGRAMRRLVTGAASGRNRAADRAAASTPRPPRATPTATPAG